MKLIVCFQVLFFICSVCHCHSNFSLSSLKINNNGNKGAIKSEITLDLNEKRNHGKGISRNLGDLWKIMPLHVMENSKSITLKCFEAYNEYLHNLQNNDLNATKMFDATAKLPSGILSGNVNQYGNFDECVELENAQYCLAEMDIAPIWKNPYSKFKNLVHSYFAMEETFDDPKHRVPGFTMIKWGFCIPKECSHVDLQNSLKEKLNIKSIVRPEMCQSNYRPKSDTTIGEYIGRSFFLIIILATLASSIGFRNMKVENHASKWKRILCCFSIQKNYSELITIQTNSKEIKAVHGVRALSALALLMSHKVVALLYNPYINRTEMTETLGQRWSVIGRTAILYTECFMLLSGLLTANSLFSDLDKYRKMQFKEKFIHRLFRILPNLVAVITFCTFFLPHMGSGPLWPLVVTHHSELCKKYMWRNFLFVHNYYGFKDMCLTHTHQIGIDMQLFMISPLFVYVMWKQKKTGFWIVGVTVLTSTILRYWITWHHELSYVVHFGIPISRMFKTADLSYILPTHRATIYLTGVCLAYILRYSDKKIRFSNIQLFIIWIIAYTLGFSVWFGPANMSVIGYEYNQLQSAIYGAISPIFWGGCIAWIIYATDRGYGGWMGTILNWKYFLLFTKISYAVYLVQFPVFFYNIGKTKHIDEYNPKMMLQIEETGLIVIFSTLLTLLIEMPFQNIKKVIFDKERKKQDICTAEVQLQVKSSRKSKLG